MYECPTQASPAHDWPSHGVWRSPLGFPAPFRVTFVPRLPCRSGFVVEMGFSGLVRCSASKTHVKIKESILCHIRRANHGRSFLAPRWRWSWRWAERGTLHTARGKALPKHASILGVCSISSTNQCFMFFVSGSPDSARVQHFYEVRQKRTPVRILFRLVIISNVYDVHD